MDGFRASVGISSIDLTAGLIGRSRYDSVQIEMSGVIDICADTCYGDLNSGNVRELKASVSIVARFGEKSLECGVPNDLAGVCIGGMDVRVWDESDSRRPSDIHASLRVALPRASGERTTPKPSPAKTKLRALFQDRVKTLSFRTP